MTARAAGLAAGKYTLTLTARDRRGRTLRRRRQRFVAHPARAALRSRDTLVYQVMIDRFRGDDGRARRAGVAGRARRRHARRRARRARRRQLRRLGVTTLWLSPVYTNPTDDRARPRRPPGRALPRLLARGAARRRSRARRRGRARRARRRRPRARPARPPRRRAQPRLRGAPVLRRALAQPPGIDPPPARRDPGAISWFNDGPDALRLRRSRLRLGRAHRDLLVRALPARSQLAPPRRRSPPAPTISSGGCARFDVDGVRIDAVPMMPRAATRRIVAAVAQRDVPRADDLLVVGENLHRAGDGGRGRSAPTSARRRPRQRLRLPAHVGAARRRRPRRGGGFATLERRDRRRRRRVGRLGRGHGAHDRQPRHHALRLRGRGDAGGDPWTAPPPQPTDRRAPIGGSCWRWRSSSRCPACRSSTTATRSASPAPAIPTRAA